MAQPPPSEKPALRYALRTARKAFVATFDDTSRTVLETDLSVNALPFFGSARIVAGYHAYGDEIDPVLLLAALRQRGIVVAFPRVADNGARLVFHTCARAALVPGFKGIMEPPATTPEVDPDLILVPLVGIDASGNRIGQGAGHYDRTLANLTARTLGLAWDVQLVDTIQADPWDRPLDALATPTRLLIFG